MSGPPKLSLAGGEVFAPGVRDAAARAGDYLDRQLQVLDAIVGGAPEPTP